MRVTVGLLSYFATKRNRRITLLVSTTGDTGPAAVQAVADIANPLLTILVHYPEGQISPFQRKQMTCIASDVVIVATFQGGGDDMDLPIKNMLTQQDTSSGRYLAGVNSYNFARPMAQIVHHVSLGAMGFKNCVFSQKHCVTNLRFGRIFELSNRLVGNRLVTRLTSFYLQERWETLQVERSPAKWVFPFESFALLSTQMTSLIELCKQVVFTSQMR